METETRSEQFKTVETWSDPAILAAIVEGQRAAIAACEAASGPIAQASALLAGVWRRGGRIGYAGAGSSGLIALLDALELPCTYGLETARLPVMLAGGAASLTVLDQESEDDVAAAAAAFRASGLKAGDALLAVSASGATPYTLAVARAAKEAGVQLVALVCNATAPLLVLADVPVALRTGPEIVAGSTRMNAGTAQKCALNMISTLTGIRLHHVYQGMMVNVRAENAKLRERAAGMLVKASGARIEDARAHLLRASWAVKPALLTLQGATAAEAERLLAAHGGDLHAALAEWERASNGGEA